MKKISIILLLVFIAGQLCLSQPTQSGTDLKMKQLPEQTKKYNNDSARSKAIKELMDQQKQITDAMKNRTAVSGTAATIYPDPSEYGNVDNWKFPAKNISALSLLPKKAFTKPELVNFLNDVYSQLSKKLPAGINSSVRSIAAKYNNDGNKMGDAAVTGWYTNYREESLLLIIKAAACSPDNGLLLNNCAAILNMGGIEEKAIPILKYVLQWNINSSMVLNNLGQAYAGLGETDTAMMYLKSSIKAEPENPEANNTAGQIEAAKGNTKNAISYFEQSIKGAYNKPAELKLRKIKKGSTIVPLIRPRVKIPEYFNQFKYKFPPQCTSTNNAVVAAADYKAFHSTVSHQLEGYMQKIAQLQQKLSQNNSPFSGAKKTDFKAQPFYEFSGIMARDIMKDYTNDLNQYDNQFYADYAAIENEYKGKLKLINEEFTKRADRCCGEGKTSDCCPTPEEKCKAYNDLANQYLPKYAMITEDWQNKSQNYFNLFFDELVYWEYLNLHPLGDDYFRFQCFYPIIAQYLSMLNKTGMTKIIQSCNFEPTTSTIDSNAISEMECPLDIEIPFVVGKFELNCEKFSFSGGEGAVFSYEKEFKTHQSTVSVGIGLKLELAGKAGPVKAGVSAGMSETFFITFDGNNAFADGGLKFDAGASAGVSAQAGTHVQGKKDLAKEKTGVGYTVGINSGWNFNPGPFKGMTSPASESQINPGVKMYKANGP